MLDSGGFESRQRVLVDEPAVEAVRVGRPLARRHLLAGRRPLHPGGVRASWRDEGGRLRLLGGATLLTFGPPESCPSRRRRHVPPCDSRAACSPSEQAARSRWRSARGRRARAERHGRGVPAAARRTRRRALVDGRALRQGAEPVPRGRQPPLLRAAGAKAGS